MKRIVLLFFIFIYFNIIFTGCNPKTIDKAIEENIPYNVKKIINKIQLDDDKILVFYTFDIEDDNKIKKIDDILNVAIFSGNSAEGWEFLGVNGWSNYYDKDMEVYDDIIFYNEGQKAKDIAVMYGRIYNQDIINVKIGNNKTGYINANIFENDGIRYFYRVYNQSNLEWERKINTTVEENISVGVIGFNAKGISKNGKVIVVHRGE